MGNQSVTGDFVGVSRETLARSLDEDEDLVDYEPDDIFITNEQPNTTMDVPTERIDEIDSMNTADASLQSRDHTQVSKEASESVRRRRRSESDTYEIDNREISRELDKSSLFDSSLSHSWRVDLNVIENRDQRTEILPITLNGRNADSSSNNTKFGVRYFIMKSHNHQNVQKSQNSGVWATQPINASILSEAFKIAERVVLIFSVNESRHFQGFGYMLSDVGTVEHASWTRVSESSLGGNFRVRWQKIGNLPFEKTVHIRNPWNENKPVKISRDGQELPVSVGEKLCQLFDEVTDKLSPIKDVDSKDELEDRSKMRRSNSTDFSDRYRPYEKSNRMLHSSRSRLFRDTHTRNYSRVTHNSGTARDYVSFATGQGYTNIPQRAWQTFDSRSPFYDQVTNASRRPFHDRGGRR